MIIWAPALQTLMHVLHYAAADFFTEINVFVWKIKNVSMCWQDLDPSQYKRILKYQGGCGGEGRFAENGFH